MFRSNFSGNTAMYGISILDELHHYFPELLYNRGRFNNLQDIFDYVNSILPSINGYPQGLNMYRTSTQQPPPICPHCHNSIQNNYQQLAGTVRRRDAPVRRMVNRTTIPQTNRTARQQTSSPGASLGSSPRPPPAVISTHAPAATPTQTTTTATPSINHHTNRHLQRDSPSQIPVRVQISEFYTPTNTNVSDVLDGLLADTNITNIFDTMGVFGNIIAPSILNLQNLHNLESVVVRPTQAQIDVATDIHTVAIGDNSTCAICLSQLQEGDEVRVITYCNHTYHKICIDRHFQESVRCPLCRHDIRELRSS